MKQVVISHGDPTEFDSQQDLQDHFRVVRTYAFKPGAYRRRALYCDVWFPDWPEDMNRFPAISIQFELDEPAHVDILKNRLHVWCHWSVPSRFVIDEVSRFFQTLKQMYSL